MKALAVLLLLSDPAIELPVDKKTPVLVLDHRGGFGPPRPSDKPFLTIRADGTIDAWHLAPGPKLTPAEVQELLRFAIEKHKLMEFDRKAVEKKAKGGAYITDASDTIITIAIKGKKHTARYYASTWAAQQFPAIKELQDLEAVRKRLQSLWCARRLGGKAAAKRVVDLANAELKKRHPKEPPLVLDDLNNVYDRAGVREVQVARWTAKGSVGAYVSLPKKGKPGVKVFVQPR